MNKFFEFAKEHPFIALGMVTSLTTCVVETVKAVVGVFKKKKEEPKKTVEAPKEEESFEVKEEETESEK